MTRYQAIFFDAGQTLICPRTSMVDMCVKLAAEHGLVTTAHDVENALPAANSFMVRAQQVNRHIWTDEQSIRAFWRDYYTIVFRQLGMDGSAPACSEEIYDRFNLHENWQVFPDVIGVLEELRERKYTLGVVSDWGDRLVHQILIPLGLGWYFDFMIASATVRAAKPGPLIFELALRRAGSRPQQTMHVGDSYVGDVIGARTAGITPVLLDRPGLVEQIDCLKIRSMEQVLEHIL